jgi:hypothetical protein
VASSLDSRVVGVLDLVPDLDAKGLVGVLDGHLAARAGSEWAAGLLDEPERYSWCRLSRRVKNQATAGS